MSKYLVFQLFSSLTQIIIITTTDMKESPSKGFQFSIKHHVGPERTLQVGPSTIESMLLHSLGKLTEPFH